MEKAPFIDMDNQLREVIVLTYEVVAKDGYMDVIDKDTFEVMAHKVRFRASKGCTLCGGRFYPGDTIEVSFPVSVDINQGDVRGGPWEFESFQARESGGCTSNWIRNNAIDIVDCAAGTSIYRAPYTKTFLVKAKRETRAQLMKSIIRSFLDIKSY